MSLTFAKYSAVASRFPRVSGDEPQALACVNADLAFSPRERG